jgi:dipeptidyl aminopeptidase/acylaminoacyl peptidase
MNYVHGRAWPWEDWDWFRERSPITYAEQSRTPILILHGKDDPRVHPSQSMELYRYLKTLGKTPVRLVLYPGEGHGNNKSAARYDYCLRLLQWMEHYLKDPGRRDAPPPAYELTYPVEFADVDDE